MKWIPILIMIALGVGCGTPVTDDDHGHDHAVVDDDHGHPHGPGEDAHDEDEAGWAVTAWGDAFEVFAEADPLVAGRKAKSFTHVTVLDGFRPLEAGVVAVVLRADDGHESVFRRDRALRSGIFEVLVLPPSAGEYDLVYRIEGAGHAEDVAAGRVRVGTSTTSICSAWTSAESTASRLSPIAWVFL